MAERHGIRYQASVFSADSLYESRDTICFLQSASYSTKSDRLSYSSSTHILFSPANRIYAHKGINTIAAPFGAPKR